MVNGTQTRRIMQMLGLARRAGALLIGQDDVFADKGARLLVLTTDELSESVARKVEAGASAGRLKQVELSGISRAELGHAIGINGAQIAALPQGSGFADKIVQILEQGGADI